MKKIITLVTVSAITCSSFMLFAGNNAQVIIPGQDPSKKPFVMAKGLVEGEDYLAKTIILKVKSNFRQN